MFIINPTSGRYSLLPSLSSKELTSNIRALRYTLSYPNLQIPAPVYCEEYEGVVLLLSEMI